MPFYSIVISFLIFSKSLSPMPLTFLRSSILVKFASLRYSKIALALASPIPFKLFNSFSVAVLIFTAPKRKAVKAKIKIVIFSFSYPFIKK